MSYQFAYRDVAEALYHALTGDAFYIAMEHSVSPAIASGKEGMLRYMDYSMVEAKRYGKLTISEPELGAAIWSVPQEVSSAHRRAADKQAFLLRHLGAESLALYLEITANMSEQTSGFVPSDAWYLSILAVSPNAQGRGLGQTLLGDVLAKADQCAVNSYLETFTPRNQSFYRRLGYRDIATVVEPTTGAAYTVMLREPAAQSGVPV